jgi:hypothetical protein
LSDGALVRGGLVRRRLTGVGLIGARIRHD